MQVDDSGPATGAGAKWTCKSKSQGDGETAFTTAGPGKRIACQMLVGRPQGDRRST